MYEILTEKYPLIKIVGHIQWGEVTMNILALEAWDIEQGANLRYGSYNCEPYIRTLDGRMVKNPTYRTGLLRLKQGTTTTYQFMGDSEQWDGDFVRIRITWYDKPVERNAIQFDIRDFEKAGWEVDPWMYKL